MAITFWWIQRPIKPVILSAEEKKVVDGKLEKMSAGLDERPASLSRAIPSPNPSPTPAANPTYVPGGKELRLTGR